MIEAILLIFSLAFIAGLIASIIGIVIGFRRKQWRLAIIASSITVVVLVIFTAINESTNLLDESNEPVSVGQASALPTAVPTLAPEPEPTSVPETIVSGLGVSRDEVEKFFESGIEELGYKGLEFKSMDPESDGTPQIGGGIKEPVVIALTLTGQPDNLTKVKLIFGGQGPENTGIAVDYATFLLAKTIPEWDNDNALEWVVRNAVLIAGGEDGGRSEKYGKVVRLSGMPGIYRLEVEQASASSKILEPGPTPLEQVSTPTVIAGLGFTRGQFSWRLVEFGYVFGVDGFCPEICTSASVDASSNVVFWLYGPHANLDKVRLEGNVLSDSADTGIAIANLLHIVMPDASDAVRSWLRTDVLESLDSAGGDSVYQSIVMDNKQVDVEVDKVTGKLHLSIRPAR